MRMRTECKLRERRAAATPLTPRTRDRRVDRVSFFVARVALLHRPPRSFSLTIIGPSSVGAVMDDDDHLPDYGATYGLDFPDGGYDDDYLSDPILPPYGQFANTQVGYYDKFDDIEDYSDGPGTFEKQTFAIIKCLFILPANYSSPSPAGRPFNSFQGGTQYLPSRPASNSAFNAYNTNAQGGSSNVRSYNSRFNAAAESYDQGSGGRAREYRKTSRASCRAR